jgi:excisionase family DNA binding protein
MSRLYTVVEVALILHVKPSTIYVFAKTGRLEYIRVGRLIRISEVHLTAFLRSHTMSATPERTSGNAEAGVP